MKGRSSKKDAAGASPGAAHDGSLEAYRKKRDPARTTEPFAAERIGSAAGAQASATGAFVVHLHDATRRHWDVRVQVGSVLKSFAVPKGPSLDPREKRLAMHTEDHPLAYVDFEEVIPEGNYGAGSMIAWDMGRVRYLEPPEEGFQKGKLDFVLSGFKLRGRFAFVRTGDRAGRSKAEKNQWLLIKKEDAFSDSAKNLVEEQPESVLSGLTVEGLVNKREHADAIEARARELGAKEGEVDARSLVPMLCQIGGMHLTDPGRLYELKLDGVRLLADRRGEDASLTYRSLRLATTTYPEVARAVRALAPNRVVLDGEVVAFDAEGRPSFGKLGRRMHLTRPHDVAHAAADVPVVYVVFDVLAVGPLDLRRLPLSARKELLAQIVPPRGVIRLLDHLGGDGTQLFEFCKTMGLEGVVAKRKNSPYRPGPDRTDDWVKIKREREADFVVVGWVEGKGGRKGLGAVEVASVIGGRTLLRSRVGSGLDDATIKKLHALLTPLEVTTPTAEGDPAPGGGSRHSVRPEIVVNVSFSGWTDDGGLRHPVFRGIRADVGLEACAAAPPEEVTDAPESRAPVAPAAPAKTAGKPRFQVSNRNKVFWPDEGYTKGELVDYYRAVAPVMLPFLRERPIVLVRYPDGIAGKNFYQWNVPEGTPSWIRTFHIESDDGPGKTTFLVDDVDGLAYIANLGCIPVHVLPFRTGAREECDYFVVDFDIAERPFSDAIILALSLRELLDELGLVGFPKTSGQSGLHVLVPLGPGVSFDASKTLVELVGRLLQSRHPDIATMERRVTARGGRALIDVGQTGRSRTIVGPYSVRAHPGATVSMPLVWEDVHRALDPREFSMFTVVERALAGKSPLETFFDVRPDIPAVIDRLGRKLGAG